ncbi:MAG: type I DNA topoisomerase [bacterium]
MSKNLIIVESPAKARTIQKFAPKNFLVKASMGHIRDLPKTRLGVDVENEFAPHYVVIKGKAPIIKELKLAVKAAKEVFLAPDPDREGEAIAWHLAALVDQGRAIHRICLHEITKPALSAALASPSEIDINKVNAQPARRILDRLVGYKLSPLLWAKVTGGLSAGRVQSVAVRLICEREREILAFVAEEYWTLAARLFKDSPEVAFDAMLVQKNQEKIKITNEEQARAAERDLASASYSVREVTRKEQKKNPAPPFITSTLQQEASRRLGFRVSKTMQVAQQLYEGLDVGSEGTVGLISYMRTDSTRISEAARAEALEFIGGRFGSEYQGPPRKYKSRPGAQEAHEAIRPTSMLRDPEEIKNLLTRDQYRLYRLIWERFLASQMASCILNVETADISAGEYLLRASGTSVKFPGFTRVYEEAKDEEQTNGDKVLPPLEAGDSLSLLNLDLKQKFTQPPPRYNEATLVKTLEEKGIGRPSTYAPIVETILKREYVKILEKRFFPTELGFVVTDLLIKHFQDIVNPDFTAAMEEKLDQIEEGQVNWVTVLRDFYGPFSRVLADAETQVEKVVLEPEITDEVCPKCGKPMVIKKGRFGKFLACSGYPECRSTKPFLKEVGLPCPNEGCTGQVIERRGKKAKFYGCSRYPECTFSSWDKPTDKKCVRCGKVMVLRATRGGKFYLACIDRECGKGATVKPEEAGQEEQAPKEG